jgi:glucuronosyltransferase
VLIGYYFRFKMSIREVRDLLFDKPMTGLDKAVWWSEYIIRHKGATHLRSPTADISWFDYLMLDVAIAVTLIAGIITYISYALGQMSNSYRKRKLKYH